MIQLIKTYPTSKNLSNLQKPIQLTKPNLRNSKFTRNSLEIQCKYKRKNMHFKYV